MLQTKTKSASDHEFIMLQTGNVKLPSELDGHEKTENDNYQINATGTPEMSSTQGLSSTQDAAEEIQQLVSQPYSKTLEAEEYGSMKLLGDTAKQLHSLMTGLIDSKKQNEFQRIHSGDINDVCNLANNISKLMKVKVEAIKVASKIVRESK